MNRPSIDRDVATTTHLCNAVGFRLLSLDKRHDIRDNVIVESIKCDNVNIRQLRVVDK